MALSVSVPGAYFNESELRASVWITLRGCVLVYTVYLGFRFIQIFQIFTQGRNDRFITVGILSEDILDDDNGLLHHVIDLGLNQIQQHIDATFRRTVWNRGEKVYERVC